jgi:hypothetical protein
MKGGSLYDVSLHYRVCQLQELAQISAAQAVHLEKARKRA